MKSCPVKHETCRLWVNQEDLRSRGTAFFISQHLTELRPSNRTGSQSYQGMACQIIPSHPNKKETLQEFLANIFFLKKNCPCHCPQNTQKKNEGKKKVISWANKGSSLPHATSRASQPHNQTLVTHGYTMVTSR